MQNQIPFSQMFSWTEKQMPVTVAAYSTLPDLQGVRLAYAGHITHNVALALKAFMDKGADLFIISCSRVTARDDIVSWLKSHGATTHAWHNMSEEDYQQAIEKALEWKPTHTCEMGADITVRAHEIGYEGIKVALEATGSGINRLGELTPRYPIFNWDDLPTKEGLHNRHMVGVVACQTFSQRTFLSLHGKRVGVVGYGSVGRGCADAARADGGVVSIIESSTERRLEARYDGWHTGELANLAPELDVIITATGAKGVVTADILKNLKPGAFLFNVGHNDYEIAVDAFESKTEVLPFVEECQIGDRSHYLLAGGSLLNLTAGQGDSLNAFDVTCATMVYGVGFAAAEGVNWEKGVYPLPRKVWLQAADTVMRQEGW